MFTLHLEFCSSLKVAVAAKAGRNVVPDGIHYDLEGVGGDAQKLRELLVWPLVQTVEERAVVMLAIEDSALSLRYLQGQLRDGYAAEAVVGVESKGGSCCAGQ